MKHVAQIKREKYYCLRWVCLQKLLDLYFDKNCQKLKKIRTHVDVNGETMSNLVILTLISRVCTPAGTT
jgi:hypothetical protein